MAVHITYFVHGTTTDNESGISTGWNQGELSTLGKQQSIDLRGHIAEKKFDIVFCSDLRRAVDSAHLIFGKNVLIIKDKHLRECNYGSFNGGNERVVAAMKMSCIVKPFPGGESYRDVEKRMREFCERLREGYQGKQVAIVAHQAPQLALDVILKGKTWQEAMDGDWRNRKVWQPGWDYTIPGN